MHGQSVILEQVAGLRFLLVLVRFGEAPWTLLPNNYHPNNGLSTDLPGHAICIASVTKDSNWVAYPLPCPPAVDFFTKIKMSSYSMVYIFVTLTPMCHCNLVQCSSHPMLPFIAWTVSELPLIIPFILVCCDFFLSLLFFSQMDDG